MVLAQLPRRRFAYSRTAFCPPFLLCGDSNERFSGIGERIVNGLLLLFVPYAVEFRSVVCSVVLNLGGRCHCARNAMPNVVFELLSV